MDGEGSFVGVAVGGHQAQGAQAGVEGRQVDELGAAADAARQLAVAVGVEDVVVEVGVVVVALHEQRPGVLVVPHLGQIRRLAVLDARRTIRLVNHYRFLTAITHYGGVGYRTNH